MGILVIGEPFRKAGKKLKYIEATCDCGNRFELRTDRVKYQVSCCCVVNKTIKHGYVGTRTYKTWTAMKSRCKHQPHYVNKRITVCERWLTFDNFLADMGERPVGTSIDRIDNSKGYEPQNCRWATSKTQGRNKDANQRFIVDGVEMTLADIADIADVSYVTMKARLNRGWTIEDAMSKNVSDVSELKLTIYGKTMRLSEWARISGVKPKTVKARLSYGYKHKEAIFGKLKDDPSYA